MFADLALNKAYSQVNNNTLLRFKPRSSNQDNYIDLCTVLSCQDVGGDEIHFLLSVVEGR